VLTVIVGLFAIIVCVALNAFFVAAEFALVTVRYTWVEEIAHRGHASAWAVKTAIRKLDDSIAATQLGITVASITLGWLGEPALAALVEPVLRPLLPHWYTAAAHGVATLCAFALITFLHVVLGELAPKAVALGRPEAVALRVARPLLWFQRVFRPIIWAMNGVGNRVVRALGFEPASGEARVHSVGELKMLVEQTHDAGDLDPTQAGIVQHALAMTDKRVRDVMVPFDRAEVLELEMSEDEILARIYATQHTRMPVRSRITGRIVGVANTKVVLLQHLRDNHVRLEEAMYVPATFHHAASLPRALRTFKRRRQHMALVAGDGGAKIGIVTLEDVLEELVGDIDDELDVVTDAPPREVADEASDDPPASDRRVSLRPAMG
jgi:putative hemolysin